MHREPTGTATASMDDAAATPLLQVTDLEVSYRSSGFRRTAEKQAVQGVCFTIGRSEVLGLVGESGSGKSSIGNALAGLAPATGGRIVFDGHDITHAGRRQRKELARRIQLIFQDPYGSMNPARTVADTVGEALRYNLELSQREVHERTLTALEDVGLPPDAADRYPGQFSGGQRQRIAIARAIAMEPEFIVCDEVVSALDLSVQAQVLGVLADLKRRKGLSYLFISHDLSVVRYLADRIAVLLSGRLLELGAADQVTAAPAHPYSEVLLAAAPVPDPAVQARRREYYLAGSRPTGAAAGSGCVFAARCAYVLDACRAAQPALTTRADGGADACLRSGEWQAQAATRLRPGDGQVPDTDQEPS